MKELKRETEFLERVMQRVRMRLNRMQQDPLLTLTTLMTNIQPKQLTEPEYHNYPENDHYIDQIICEHDMYVKQNDLAEKQLRADALLSRQLQDEERKQNNQAEYDEPPEYHRQVSGKIKKKNKQLQETDNKPFARSNMREQAPNY